MGLKTNYVYSINLSNNLCLSILKEICWSYVPRIIYGVQLHAEGGFKVR